MGGSVDLQVVSEGMAELSLSDIGEGFELIPLETTDSVLLNDIRRIEKVVHRGGEYYIVSGSIVYRFSDNGAFLNTIGRIGRGPGEYTSLRDFDVEGEEKQVVILASGKIFVFSPDGNLRRLFDAEPMSMSVAVLGSTIVTYSDNMTESSANSFCFYDPEGNKTGCLPSYYGYDGEVSTVMVFFSRPFYKWRGNLFAREFHSDTVVMFRGTRPEPYIVLSSGTGRYTPELRTSAVSPRDYVIVEQLFETADYLVVRFSYRGRSVMLFRNKGTLENIAVNVKNGIPDDVTGGSAVRVFHYSEEEDCLFYLINATEYLRYREKAGGPEIAGDGNPVIVRFRIRKSLQKTG